jgi:LIVCS family branched-chain amino acid:cation transporter
VNMKSPSTLVVGLAFFSMFFGAGNLIFPLLLGARYESYFLICSLGFIITAALLPIFGILAMIYAKGDYRKLFLDLLPDHISRWFFLLVLIFWIPLGSGPRCIILAHASIKTYVSSMPPMWMFSLLFLVVVYGSIASRNKVIDVLGKFLTPLLLISLFFIVLTSFMHGEIDQSEHNGISVFFESLADGYYTQDLIAAIFFSSTIVGMLNLKDQKAALKKTWYGGLIAVGLLAVIYTTLMAASAIHAEHLQNLSGEKLVSTLAQLALGSSFGGISSVAVSIACLTTEIALVLVFADFLHEFVFDKKHYHIIILATLALIWVLSLFDFAFVMGIIAPAMKIIYPILFILALRLIWRSRRIVDKFRQ